MFFNIPIFLTWLRIVLIPLIVGVYYLPVTILGPQEKNEAAAAIFILAALTDWFDGFLARKLNQTSAFGAFLDPVADKLMMTAALLVLVHLMRLDLAIALLIVGREIAISALREWMAQIGASKSVAVNSLGKLKTACQMIAIPMLLYYAPIVLGRFAVKTHIMGKWLIYLATVLTIWSMLYYMKLAWSKVRDHRHIFIRLGP
ncbi:CDP-diacylglycerol--glycerol-3-phosphate 3-phosphatidyltransferase [Candidatus Vallotia cooleyia]|uniref:CDP-diacylglycerol--glycerol-3-phosphate 3-phosphatidyltransferase n=1 Tax=Candidatus Vallotiella adelgis TaxID=1177211 RepID=UPI001D01EF45|nr:CDP-diacylglycerol--glycerol-3-phosphate 3-phosphatidyltransferase [Candidatus Vallotia cooleyia]